MPLLMGCDNLETKSVVRMCDLRNSPCIQMKFRGDLFSRDRFQVGCGDHIKKDGAATLAGAALNR
jgi:hypothetical protein